MYSSYSGIYTSLTNGVEQRSIEENVMSGIILTLPIVAGKVEAWRRFCQEMSGSRIVEHEASRLQQDITRERLAIIETEFGSAAVITLEADDVGRALQAILSSDLPFDRWYRTQMQILHGINLAGYEQFSRQQAPAENQELLFEWIHPSIHDNGQSSH
jgi:hypothetical protein